MTAEADKPTLKVADRGDCCGAQAFVRVTLLSGGLLLFCGHHFARNEAALAPLVDTVTDERSRINETKNQGMPEGQPVADIRGGRR